MKTNIFKRPVTIKEQIKSAGQTNGTVIGTIGTLTAKEVLDVDTTINSTIISVAGTTIGLTAEAVELLAKGLSTGFTQAHQWLDEVNLQLEADAQRAQQFADERMAEAITRSEAKLIDMRMKALQGTVSTIKQLVELNMPYEPFIEVVVKAYKADEVNTKSLETLHQLINIYSAEGIDVTYLTQLYQNIQQQLP